MTVFRGLTLRVLLLLLFGARICFGSSNPAHMGDVVGVVDMEACLDCHSESLRRPDRIHFGNYCLLSASYPPAGREREFTGLADVERSGIVLESGKVTCLSCHDLTKAAPHVIKEGFQLCSICHTTLNMIK